MAALLLYLLRRFDSLAVNRAPDTYKYKPSRFHCFQIAVQASAGTNDDAAVARQVNCALLKCRVLVVCHTYYLCNRTFPTLNCVQLSLKQILKPTRLEICIRLKATGFDLVSLKAAGFDLISLKAAGFDAASLFFAGFLYKELKDAGFASDELDMLKVRTLLQPGTFSFDKRIRSHARNHTRILMQPFCSSRCAPPPYTACV